jgi:hypothetical protein
MLAVVRSFATKAVVPHFVMVVAVKPLTARVGLDPVLAAVGFHRTVKPAVKAVAAGESVTVCAWAVPPPAAYQFTLVSEVPIRDFAAVAVLPVLLPQK